MKKINYFFCYFPITFLLFLAIYIFVKFIFIFFFNTSFEPGFLFNLTPFYLLSGFSRLNLLLLSLIIIWINVYLHINISKKKLLISFLPTVIMLSSLGLEIAVNEINISIILNYIIFFCLILTLIIDHKLSLRFPDYIYDSKSLTLPRVNEDKSHWNKLKSRPVDSNFFAKTIQIEGMDKLLNLQRLTLYNLKKLVEDKSNKNDQLFEKLEKRMQKIDILSQDIVDRRNRLKEDENLFRQDLFQSSRPIKEKNPIKSSDIYSIENEIPQEKDFQNPIINDFLKCDAILKRGIIKKANISLTNLLGYKKEDLLNRCLFDFIDYEGYSNVKRFYFNRLNGKQISTFKTIFLTKDRDKLYLEVTLKPKYHDNQRFEMAYVKNLEKNS